MLLVIVAGHCVQNYCLNAFYIFGKFSEKIRQIILYHQNVTNFIHCVPPVLLPLDSNLRD